MGPYSFDDDGGAIYHLKNAYLYMTIEDLSHAKAITFNIGKSDRFIKVITLERTVGPDYCPPNRNVIVG